MSAVDAGSIGDSGGTSAFDPRVIGALIIAGIIAFIAFWVLTAFAPQLGGGRDGGAHALSRSGTSYSALVELLRDQGVGTEIDRGNSTPDGLLILTPPVQATADDIVERIDSQDGRPVLIVPQRRMTTPDPDRAGWVRQGYMVPNIGWLGDSRFGVAPQLASTRGGMTAAGWLLPDRVTVFLPTAALEPVIIAPDGGIVLGRLATRRNVYLLADADLLANHGVATPERAATAVRLIRALAEGGLVRFDVVLNGYGAGRSILRLAFVPPFVGLTLCLLAAGLLALWSGFVRFGPAWREQRTLRYGKAGLVTNSARLIVQAQRVRHFAATYAQQVRDAAARRLHAPAGLDASALDAWLDRFPDRRGQHFSRLAADLVASASTIEAVTRARALGQWRKDILRDSG